MNDFKTKFRPGIASLGILIFKKGNVSQQGRVTKKSMRAFFGTL